MRRLLVLTVLLSLFGLTLGCRHTSGVCDCHNTHPTGASPYYGGGYGYGVSPVDYTSAHPTNGNAPLENVIAGPQGEMGAANDYPQPMPSATHGTVEPALRH